VGSVANLYCFLKSKICHKNYYHNAIVWYIKSEVMPVCPNFLLKLRMSKSGALWRGKLRKEKKKAILNTRLIRCGVASPLSARRGEDTERGSCCRLNHEPINKTGKAKTGKRQKRTVSLLRGGIAPGENPIGLYFYVLTAKPGLRISPLYRLSDNCELCAWTDTRCWRRA